MRAREWRYCRQQSRLKVREKRKKRKKTHRKLYASSSWEVPAVPRTSPARRCFRFRRRRCCSRSDDSQSVPRSAIWARTSREIEIAIHPSRRECALDAMSSYRLLLLLLSLSLSVSKANRDDMRALSLSLSLVAARAIHEYSLSLSLSVRDSYREEMTPLLMKSVFRIGGLYRDRYVIRTQHTHNTHTHTHHHP